MKESDIRSSERCGIVLAAGEGKRLQGYIERLRGDTLPKQYVSLIGRRSMLEHTIARAETVIEASRLFTVVSGDHLNHPEVGRQLSTREPGTVIVQPENKETAPGILLPLAYISRRYPNAKIAVFPSDHYIAEVPVFMNHVNLAYRLLDRCPEYLVLLGIEPHEPETDYGYILPAKPAEGWRSTKAYRIARFHEKPETAAAQAMIRAGGLWNTMVMVFKAQTLIDLVHQVSPRLHRFFKNVQQTIGTTGERGAIKEIYRETESINFSRGLLEPLAQDDICRLLVLPVRGVTWSDWGSEARITRTLRAIDRQRGQVASACAL
jgi:mannose-1-phosphate guanylyltransferase